VHGPPQGAGLRACRPFPQLERDGPPHGERDRRKSCVKGVGAAVRESSTAVESGRRGVFLELSDSLPNLIQELAMADLAFVLTTIAVFALVALVAKGVTKL
jgi:uncharacterized membrane protein YqjE